MPTYKVKAKGFYDGMLYDPEGKRKTLTTDKPFTKKNPMPSWLDDMPKESPALKKKREAYELLQKANDELKAEEDQNDISKASTDGDGQETSFLSKVANAVTGNNNNVETL